jgi:hypothetical protein
MSRQIPVSGTEVLSPGEAALVGNLMSRVSGAAAMTPWERHKLEWQLRKQRGQLIIQLADVEREAVLAEAVVAGQGRIAAATERAAVAHVIEQLRCLQAAGEALDDGMHSASTLSEDSRSLVQGAMLGVVGNYARSVRRRAGRIV